MQKKIGNNLALLLIGDIMCGEDFIRFKQEQMVGYDYPFEICREIFKSADIVFGNFEGTLSKSGPLREYESPNLYSPPESISALKYLNFSVVSLGNNHINDFGKEGLTETIEILRENEILHFGAGRDINEADREAVIERKGLKIAFLGYTTNEKGVNSIIAGPNTAGCVFYDFEMIKEDIERVKDKSDLICVSLHWGHEYHIYPSPEQIELAHKIIEAGAQIIIGHHPHEIQGFERYNNGVIFYSLGNFFFPNMYTKSGFLNIWPNECRKSMIVKIEISIKNKAEIEKVEITPAFMSKDYKVIILDGKNKALEVSRIEKISKMINRSDYKNFWEDYNRKRRRGLAKIQFTRLLKRARQLGFKESIKIVSMKHFKDISRLLFKYLTR